MKAQLKKYLFLLLPIFFLGAGPKAQTNYKLANAELSVSGTSSLHDWTMTSNSASGSAIFTTDGATLKSIQNLNVSMKAETLKSGKGGMDDNTYKALKTKKNPDIKFTLKEVKSIAKKGNNYLVEAVGILSIAGESKTITVQGQASPTDGTLKITGSKKFKMTDFGVDPPTALLGTIKTGDDITINFNLTYKI